MTTLIVLPSQDTGLEFAPARTADSLTADGEDARVLVGDHAGRPRHAVQDAGCSSLDARAGVATA
jgi:hypothetical protein